MKILLVSDRSLYSTSDVYTGYHQAFLEQAEHSEIEYEPFPVHEYLKQHNFDIVMCMLLSKALITYNQFTHILFVCGTSIPDYIYRTLYHYRKNIGIIATDDPHSTKKLLGIMGYIKYWFTNEKAIYEKLNERYPQLAYLPVAASPYVPIFNSRGYRRFH